MFLCGRSFGGLIATNMQGTLIGSKMFRATVLITPYYRLADEKLYRIEWQVNILKRVHPHHIIDRPDSVRDDDYMVKWGKYITDPKQIKVFTPLMASIWIAEQAKTKQNIKNIKQPFLFIEAELDVLVSNKAIREYYQLNANPNSKFLSISGVDHSNCIFDQKGVEIMMSESICFLY